MTILAKYIVILFGIFLIGAGLLMLLKPAKAREYLRRAGSTNFINYAEISIRMLPAAALVIYSDLARFPMIFKVLGWFMLATSLVLFFVPRRLHHGYALKCADILTPQRFQWISPLSLLFGGAVIYAAL